MRTTRMVDIWEGTETDVHGRFQVESMYLWQITLYRIARSIFICFSRLGLVLDNSVNP